MSGVRKINVGFVGWRGMVGSVLMERMKKENDFKDIKPIFFTTSQKGQPGPDFGNGSSLLEDAYDIQKLKDLDVIVTCQGSDYSENIFPKLSEAGYKGYWLDAASAFRQNNDSIICLDPVNLEVIKSGLRDNIKVFCGGNCTVSLMLMALDGLFKSTEVQWITSMTYQSVSGAGAKNIKELIHQMAVVTDKLRSHPDGLNRAALELDAEIQKICQSNELPTKEFGFPMVGNVLPWIDSDLGDGSSKEEWKGYAETNKILGLSNKPVSVDGVCVRVANMRCHSQALTIKISENLSEEEFSKAIDSANSWVEVIENSKTESLKKLTPIHTSGTLKIPVGRIRKINNSENIFTLFTVGDQLLWGAAEPIRRSLNIVKEFLSK